VLLGARAIQEGGAFLNMTREEVELFCIDHQVMVEITASEEALVFDFQSVTTTPGPSSAGEEVTAADGSLLSSEGVSGIEAVMQVAHIILTDFTYEDDAFERAKQSYHEQFDSTVKGLETACTESLAYSLTGADTRYDLHPTRRGHVFSPRFASRLISARRISCVHCRLLVPNHAQIDALDLQTCKEVMLDQLDPSNVEASMCGDLPISEMERLVLMYLGTVPARSAARTASEVAASIDGGSTTAQRLEALRAAAVVEARPLGREKQLGVYLQDSDERAMGYLAGPAPNRWGQYGDGTSIADRFVQQTGKKDAGRWRDPLFSHGALLILQEVRAYVLL
jgi:hypothetical protein